MLRDIYLVAHFGNIKTRISVCTGFDVKYHADNWLKLGADKVQVIAQSYGATEAFSGCFHSNGTCTAYHNLTPIQTGE